MFKKSDLRDFLENEKQDRRKTRKKNIRKEIQRRMENLELTKKDWNLERLENYPPMDGFVKEQVDDMYEFLSNISEWHNYDDTPERAPESGPGFWATQEGGWTIRFFNSISIYTGSGDFPFNQKTNKDIESMDEDAYKDSVISFKEENKKELDELNIPEDKINYHDLYDMNQGDLAERLESIYHDATGDYLVELEFRLQYYKPKGWAGDEGYEDDKYPRIYAVIDVTPGGWKEEGEFYFKNLTELKQKLPPLLEKLKNRLTND